MHVSSYRVLMVKLRSGKVFAITFAALVVLEVIALILHFCVREGRSGNQAIPLLVFLIVQVIIFTGFYAWCREYSLYRKARKLELTRMYLMSQGMVIPSPVPELPTRSQTVVFYVPVERPASVSDEDLDDGQFWCFDHSKDANDSTESCPICLYDADINGEEAVGSTKCCNKNIHVECAQRYFLSVRKVQCPFCRCSEFREEP
jgi:hypothetical protein